MPRAPTDPEDTDTDTGPAPSTGAGTSQSVERDDGWAELYATSMGGVSITYYQNGVVKRVYPGNSLTFTFPDGRAEQFSGDQPVPYPPAVGVEVPMVREPIRQRSFFGVVLATLLKGILFGVLIFVTYIVASVYIYPPL
jgi:hypothetical protein